MRRVLVATVSSTVFALGLSGALPAGASAAPVAVAECEATGSLAVGLARFVPGDNFTLSTGPSCILEIPAVCPDCIMTLEAFTTQVPQGLISADMQAADTNETLLSCGPALYECSEFSPVLIYAGRSMECAVTGLVATGPAVRCQVLDAG